MANPVMMNDLRGSWLRRKPVHAVAVCAVIILVLTLGIPGIVSMFSVHLSFWRFPDIALPIVVPLFAASAFAKEHEQRTWQDLLMTRLTNSEIVWGKFLASLIPSFTSVIILFPPFALMLIVQQIQWAQEPGVWMIALSLKFAINITLYLLIAMICSYHSANARNALVKGYIAIGLYLYGSYIFWQKIEEALLLLNYDTDNPRTLAIPKSQSPWEVSTREFNLTLADYLTLAGSCVLIFILFFLLIRSLQKCRAYARKPIEPIEDNSGLTVQSLRKRFIPD